MPQNPAYAGEIGAYLGAVLPVYGMEFADWWRDRLVPEMQHNFDYLEKQLARRDAMSLAQVAVLLEDAIDIHDRHWEIDWMLNFAQFSATLNLQAVATKHGKNDGVLLGRLQNSASDRNWDKIEALWVMKEEVTVNRDLRTAFAAEKAEEIVVGLEATERGRRFIAERIRPYQREFGWHAVWSHEFIFPSFLEQMEPIVQLVKDQIAQDYDYPKSKSKLAADIKAASEEILAGLEGERSLRWRRPSRSTCGWRRSPRTTTSTSTRAPTPMSARSCSPSARSWSRWASSTVPTTPPMHYNELRAFIGNPTGIDGRAIVAAAKAAREAAYAIEPRDWVGTCTQTQLDFPYLNLWGFPEKFHRSLAGTSTGLTGIAASQGVVEGVARVVLVEGEFDAVQEGDLLVCQMTNPAWQAASEDRSASPTSAGGFASHPGVLAREYEIPAVVGTSVEPGPSGPATGSASTAPGVSSRSSSARWPPWPRRSTEARTGMPAETAISRSVLSDAVKDRLLEAILYGRYPPGSRIVETRVARELGTSQAPVREALRDLEALGVVEIAAFRGCPCAPPVARRAVEA